MPTSDRDSTKAPLHPLFTALLLALGACAFACAWMVVAARSGDRAGWMVLVAALNAVAWLRLARTRAGTPRSLAAVLATSASIALGEWLVASLPIAQAMGQSLPDAAGRIGPDFGWMLIRLGNTPLDWLAIVVALMLAGWFGR
jgi:hypothetical protein